MSESLRTYVDGRGMLLPIELDDLPFVPVRLFVVVGPADGATRGGHDVPCRQLLVLLSGRAEVRYDGDTTELAEPGATLLMGPGGHVDYDLAPGGSTVLVLADAAYDPE